MTDLTASLATLEAHLAGFRDTGILNLIDYRRLD